MSKSSRGRNRRDFLAGSLGAFTAATVLPGRLKGDNGADKAGKETPAPVTRKLGKTGLTLPIVSMGVMNAENPNLVRAALDQGMIMLDTAHYYQRGRNEEMVGKVLRDVPRDSVVLATKARATVVDRTDAQAGKIDRNGRETVPSFIEKVHLSLKRLGTDYVDILYLHSAKSGEDASDPVTMKAMAKLKKEGTIRHLGISTHQNEPEVILAALETGFYEVILVAYNFMQKGNVDLHNAIKKAANQGVGIVAMKTQAGAFWDRERTRPIPMKAALKWALQNEHIHTSVPGFTTFDQMEDDLDVMVNPTLTSEEKLSLAPPEEQAAAGLFCRQCGSCLAQCPENVEIPTLMRAHMYAFGYRNLAAAKSTFEEKIPSKLPCTDCTSCSVRCPAGHTIQDNLVRIAAIKGVPEDFLL